MPKFLVFISFLLWGMLVPVSAQTATLEGPKSYFPDTVGAKVKYSATIEMRKGYVSGICVLLNDEGCIKGCLFNEFGISALDFVYFPDKHKVKLVSVIKMLNKWYIKKVLKADIAQVMELLRQGKTCYRNERFKIDYNFTLLEDDSEE